MKERRKVVLMKLIWYYKITDDDDNVHYIFLSIAGAILSRILNKASLVFVLIALLTGCH